MTETNYGKDTAVHQWTPWSKSTGPKSAEGKAKSAKNSLKHGVYSAAAEKERAAIYRLIADAAELSSAALLSAQKVDGD